MPGRSHSWPWSMDISIWIRWVTLVKLPLGLVLGRRENWLLAVSPEQLLEPSAKPFLKIQSKPQWRLLCLVAVMSQLMQVKRKKAKN